MKYLLVILLFCGLTCIAQDRYTRFKYDFMNVEIEKQRFTDNPAFKPALILLGTFAINQAIISINERNETYKNIGIITGSVFVAGAVLSIIVFSREFKKQNYEK